MEHNTPKNFALQLGALATLYISLGAFIALTFSLISIIFPDEAESYWRYESATSTIRFSIAMLVVFFPAYISLTRKVNQIRRAESGVYLGLTRWLIYLSLLVGGGILLGDAVAVIFGFLEGELTIRFFLKALVLALITGLAFYYYLKDAKGYWQTHEKQSKTYGALVAIIVAAAIMLGAYHIESPQVIREVKIDQNQIGDLQDMQWRIEDYYRSQKLLPENLEILFPATKIPTAPEDRTAYTYFVDGEKSYKLCAYFKHASDRFSENHSRPHFEQNYNWEYSAGDWCFERTIDDTYRQ